MRSISRILLFGLATAKDWNSIGLELTEVIDDRDREKVDEAYFMTDRPMKHTRERIVFVYMVRNQGVRGDFCRYRLAHRREEKNDR